MRVLMPSALTNEQKRELENLVNSKMKGCEVIARLKHPHMEGDEVYFDVGIQGMVGYGSIAGGYMIIPNSRFVMEKIEEYKKLLKEGKVKRDLWYRNPGRLRKRKGKDAPLRKRSTQPTLRKRMAKNAEHQRQEKEIVPKTKRKVLVL